MVPAGTMLESRKSVMPRRYEYWACSAPDGTETLIARYLRYIEPDGSHEFRWALSPRLSAADKAYYRGLVQQAAARVMAAGG